MEQFSDDELDHAAEEDSDKEDQDLDKMFGAWLGELDKLTKVRGSDGGLCMSVLLLQCCCSVWIKLVQSHSWRTQLLNPAPGHV
ncbi:hypothetical protein DNTS_001937 [Danionella cerebrum]|uniref:Uncharacterized protein n=1 Tax=Danionella cerebrum TaxID=2873325 RepID=A0A553RLX3_9TELE|nr:hypothetical protein DNTS_001937 [Danionella translucida]